MEIGAKRGGVLENMIPSGLTEISPIEQLLNELQTHEAKEQRSIDDYKLLMDAVHNPRAKFLLQLIISDEEKHRAMIHAMITTMKGSLTWTKPEGALEAGDQATVNNHLQAATEQLIHEEREGIRECKALSNRTARYYQGVFSVLLDAMARDSEKHVELLEFLKQTL